MTALTQQQVAQQLLRIRDAQTSFLGFCKLIYPDRVFPPFQLELINTLDALERDTLNYDNIVITMPPRHGKSEYGTILFPSYYMARDPTRFVMSSSYNATLAVGFGRQVRNTMDSHHVAQAFPNFRMASDSRAADEWHTTQNGAYFGVGLEGTTSGRPANLLIIDDPFKSRVDAESKTTRNRVWDFYASALHLRLQKTRKGQPPKQIIINTRWHPDDLVGRMMETEEWKEGKWYHIDFPAITTLPDGTRQALWPEYHPLKRLEAIERLSPREFASLYQQKPYVQGGNLIKSEWWRTYDKRPDTFVSIIITTDTAFKKSETADYSVFLVAGLDRHGDIYIIDVIRARYDFPELKTRLTALNNQWRGKALRAIYIEDKASGQSLIQELKRFSGMSIIPYKVVNDKVARVNAVLPLIEGGRVLIPEEAPWLDTFLDECISFPSSTHDDQVDALSMALDVLARTSISPDAFDHFHDASDLIPQAYGKSLSELTKSSTFKGWGL